MRRIIFTIIVICSVFCTANAQKIGHFSYNAVLQGLPAYVAAQQNLQRMRKQYADELQAAEKEFSEKYEFFIEQQSSLDPSISEKRQSELRSLYDSNIRFRDNSRRVLQQTESDLMSPIKANISRALSTVGKEGGYAVIINTDSDACPYLDGAATEDVTAAILSQLR